MCKIRMFTLLTYTVSIVATMAVNDFNEIGDRMSHYDLSSSREISYKREKPVKSVRLKKFGEKSRKKCEEYGREIVWILPLMKSRPVPITINCTYPPMNPLISGGERAKTGEFPHMAAIGWHDRDNRNYVYHCGGSLVSDRWVLTAAHCTHHATMGKPVIVRLGSNRLSDVNSGLTIIIDSIERHPAYVPPSMYADLALLKLSTPVKFTNDIKPACLDTQFGKAPTQAWVTGWGSKQRDERTSDVLLKANLDIVDNVRCSLSINFTNSVPSGVVPSMLCAGDPNGGWKKDTCDGDSGGPLQALHSNGCVYNVIGVTSFGRLCATPNYPGVYTRVSHYLEWIESIVWPGED